MSTAAEKKAKPAWRYVWRSNTRPEENHSIWRLASGELVEVGFYRRHPYDKKFMDYEFLGKGVFVKAL